MLKTIAVRPDTLLKMEETDKNTFDIIIYFVM